MIAIAAALVLTAVLGMLTLGRGGDQVAMEPGGKLPAQPPAEWSTDALWHSPVLAQDTGRALVIGGDRVALVTADPRAVVLVDAATGDVRWSADLPDGQLRDGLHTTTIDGQVVVAAQIGQRLAWWNLENGQAGGIDLPEGAISTFAGAQPLIGTSARTAAIVTNGSLVTLVVPRGALAYAASSDGTVTAAGQRGWWQLRAGRPAPKVTPWTWRTTTPIEPTVVAYTGGHLVLVLPPPGRGQPTRVLIYRDRPAPDGPVWAFDSPIVPPDGDQITWSPSTSKTWGVLGRTLVDLEQRQAHDLGPWSTIHVTADRAYGNVGDQRVIAGPGIERGVLTDGEGIPDDVTTAGALVRANADDGPREYLLPPRQQQ